MNNAWYLLGHITLERERLKKRRESDVHRSPSSQEDFGTFMTISAQALHSIALGK